MIYKLNINHLYTKKIQISNFNKKSKLKVSE